ncbi:GntR family transcriptional regulator [Methylocella tundrae]|nr:PLP-dependent aminotransferase family protein [Methylocella tundrae]VTZ25605.1 GntR family transcriptional regulator [Methylocella tundrae]
MELTLSLAQRTEKSLQTQIFEQVRQMILNGQLKAGMTLTPSRILAERLNVSRNTVTNAYDRLAGEGYVEARGTAGVYVSAIPPDDLLLIQNGGLAQDNGPILPASSEPLLCFAGSSGGGAQRPAYDFWVGRSDPTAFPLMTWRRIVNRLLSRETSHLTDYCDPAGLPELREAIAHHLGRTRGMAITHNQIIVTGGGQDALNLVLSLLRSHTRQLCIENPCYLGASMLFNSATLPLHPVPVDEEGIQTECLPTARGNLLYVTPSHQFPTGVVMTLSRRLALLRWADETDSFIIEDDYDSDFRYDGPPLTALAGLDRGRRVFYVGTFSKSVGAGLRIGFAALPRIRWDEARLLKARMSNGQSWLEQSALSFFINDGHFDRHLRKLRQIYMSRRDCLVASLNANFKEPKISGTESGLHLVWQLPQDFPRAREIQLKAREIGVGVYALSSGAAFDFDDAPNDDILVFGYSSLDVAKIQTAVTALRQLFILK